MNQPDLSAIIDNWWGGTYQEFIGVTGGASNIIVGGNPAYSVADFLTIYPKFGPSDYFIDGDVNPSPIGAWIVPGVVIEMYINLASSCLSYNRWIDQWSYGMSLFIAHYCTMWLQSEGSPGSTAKQIAESGMSKGVKISKSAGDVSLSIDPLVNGWESWGQWNLTTYGKQLISMAKMIGYGIMYIY